MTNPCQHSGSCTNTDGGYSCDCAGTGYTGTTCQTDINECTSTPCQHGGACNNTAGSYTCDCAGTGYTGTTCQTDINECTSSPCQHGGACTNTAGSYTCNCSGTGYTGTTCQTDINECTSTPCQHGGACTNTAGSYTCNCSGTGYTGTTCQTDINECTSSPCQHGGACTNTTGSYTCNCSGTGYTGTTCQTNVNECTSSPCQNSGTCTNTAGSYTCACSSRFLGTNCEYQRFRGVGALSLDDTSELRAISGDGTTAVGGSWLNSSSQVTHAVRVVNNGSISYLATPSGQTACISNAVSQNGGTIVGTCTDSNDLPSAFRYASGGSVTLISKSPYGSMAQTTGEGLSDDGNVVVGRANGAHCAKWTSSGGWSLLGQLSSSDASIALGTSSNGSTIAGYDAPIVAQGFYWTQSNGILAIANVSGASDSSAWDVSPDGTVIVGAAGFSGENHAVKWKNLTPTDLGDGTAYGTNASGSVVVGATNARIATVWDTQGAHSLSSLLGGTSDLSGWTLTIAWDVSDDGKVVVGQGINGSYREGFIAHLP